MDAGHLRNAPSVQCPVEADADSSRSSDSDTESEGSAPIDGSTPMDGGAANVSSAERYHVVQCFVNLECV